MGKINVLTKQTIDQIAAGDVIERPKSVVKELVENAIDAGATAISVETKNGGIDLVRVTDNGPGIEKEDVPTAFLSHATSKIRDASDILGVLSLGFRGEALSSIAAVSEVQLFTETSWLTGTLGSHTLTNCLQPESRAQKRCLSAAISRSPAERYYFVSLRQVSQVFAQKVLPGSHPRGLFQQAALASRL